MIPTYYVLNNIVISVAVYAGIIFMRFCPYPDSKENGLVTMLRVVVTTVLLFIAVCSADYPPVHAPVVFVLGLLGVALCLLDDAVPHYYCVLYFIIALLEGAQLSSFIWG